MPIAVLSGMKEAGIHHISVKGGRFMEAVAQADTIVFDKTGTLTHAAPRVAAVVPFGGKEENDMLALAACLEEHYPATPWPRPSWPRRKNATSPMRNAIRA